jgi:CobQ-like glutamine amidotransferase family enzyme
MKQLRFEMLYPQVANLFGDTQNLRYLKLCLPQAQLVRTSLNDEPLFVSETPDLIYLGPMSEDSQRLVIERLLPYQQRIEELILNGTIFLFTGNALEVLGERIVNAEQDYQIEGLKILPVHTEIELFARFNAKVLGEFLPETLENDLDHGASRIVGFKSQFSQVYGDNSACFFCRCQRGAGLNRASNLEGVRNHNFFGTSLLGPLLILNPLFTSYLISLLVPDSKPELAFETEIMAAYQERLKDFENPQTSGFDGKGH